MKLRLVINNKPKPPSFFKRHEEEIIFMLFALGFCFTLAAMAMALR